MTQQDALRKAIDRAQRLKLMLLNNAKGRAAFELMQAMAEDNEKFLRDLQEAKSALAEQDDEEVAYYVERQHEGFRDHGMKLGPFWEKEKADVLVDQRHILKPLYTRPAPKTYNEHDIDVAIGVFEWDKLNLFATAEAVKQIVMRFAGSQVQMEPKRLSEDEIHAAIAKSGIPFSLIGAIGETRLFHFASVIMDKMTGGGK